MAWRSLLVGLGLLVVAACDPDGGLSWSAGQSDSMMPGPAEGAALYAQNCAFCHGPDGQGDGALASEFNPPPADLTQIAARNAGVFPRTAVLSKMDGYARSSADGTDMPEFGALLDGDPVPVTLEDGTQSPVPRPLAAILAYLDSVQI